MKIKKALSIFSLTLALACVISVGVQAAEVRMTSIMSYSGTKIWSWRSVDNFKLDSSASITVDHKQTKTYPSSTQMDVIIYKSNFIGASEQARTTFYGNSAGGFGKYLGSGTYFLRFESPSAYDKFDISGRVLRS